uniref:Putative secreted protein n=1 Tax=Ixodes ricinus TaxID=34613 RepID=A0A6B0UGM1_IXORI
MITTKIFLAFFVLWIEDKSISILATHAEVLGRQLAFILYKSSTACVAGIKGWEGVVSLLAKVFGIKIASLASSIVPIISGAISLALRISR